HVANGSDSGSNQRQKGCLCVGVGRAMQIVVPETRNQEFACAVNDLGIDWRILFRDCDRDDLLSLDDHGGIFSRWMVGSVNDRGIYDRNFVLRKDGMDSRRSKKQHQEE